MSKSIIFANTIVKNQLRDCPMTTQQKVLDIYHNEGHVKAWNYWKLMGNTSSIFLGEVSGHEIIDGKLLSNHIGLTEGVLCNVDTPWLKFILDGNIVYVAKKPYRPIIVVD